jgi:hypothetical protein
VTAPAGAPRDPADQITLDDSIRMALLITMEQLTPPERAAFVLHDVFGFSFDEVATIVGRSAQACRQLASRARRTVHHATGPARFDVDHAQLHTLVDRFIAAATTGDIDGLTAVLAPDVVGWTDSGGRPGVPLLPTAGRDNVISRLLWFLRTQRPALAPMPVNGEPGVVAIVDGRLLAVIAFDTHDGLITRIHAIANTQKLAHIASAVGLPPHPPDRPGFGEYLRAALASDRNYAATLGAASARLVRAPLAGTRALAWWRDNDSDGPRQRCSAPRIRLEPRTAPAEMRDPGST